METFTHSLEQIQYPAPARRPARRWPRRTAPLRWAADRKNKRSLRAPRGGGSNSGAPPAAPGPLSQEDAAWLVSLRPWATTLVQRLWVSDSDRDDVVQETFLLIASEWSAFVPPPDLPAQTARLRWVTGLLFRMARRFRDRAHRARARAPYRLEQATDVIGAPSHEGPISARELLRGLEAATTPERWRVWVAHEVDGVPVPELARQEARSEPAIYNTLRLARRDLAAALGRDAATGSGPLVPRIAWRTRTPRA